MNPYSQLHEKAFWRKAIADKSMFDISDLWQPKFIIERQDPVSTYGSCFAQHIGRALKQRGFTWYISESAPRNCSEELAIQFNYGVFSSRTGNIYTASLLDQWVKWSLDEKSIPTEYWLRNERYIDPFRPAIEPNGFASLDELLQLRLQTLHYFRDSIIKAKFFVFTLGLTESWFNSDKEYEYPMCPGTIAGAFNEKNHHFVNQNFRQVKDKLTSALLAIREINQQIKVILTVSPVPLTATATGKHVLVATMYSKSVLRAVAGRLSDIYSWVDYFPSYEIINGTPFAGVFFEPNKRSVHPHGVDFVMNTFFRSMYPDEKELSQPRREKTTDIQDTTILARRQNLKRKKDSAVCEEALLDAFGDKK